MELTATPPQGVNYSRLHQELQAALPGVYLYMVGPLPGPLLQVGSPDTYILATPGVSVTVGLIDTATPANITTFNSTVAAHNPAQFSAIQQAHAAAHTARIGFRQNFAADFAVLNTPLPALATPAQIVAYTNTLSAATVRLMQAVRDLFLQQE